MAGGRARGIRLSMHYDNNNSLIDGRRTKGLTDFHSMSFEPNRPQRIRRRRRRFSNKQGSLPPSLSQLIIAVARARLAQTILV